MARRRTPTVDRRPYLNHRSRIEPIAAADGSAVRKLLHPSQHAIERMSIAEVEIRPEQATRLQRHPAAEKVYHILGGAGLMQLGEELLAVVPGDIIRIAPGQPHRVETRSDMPLQFLCICQPACDDEDTEYLDTNEPSQKRDGTR
ncbi:MAG TPA: cupin domain-containing protein [Guyparkeria sp.]|nr:cupin domain-containing protein [Guyparkeria sp.]